MSSQLRRGQWRPYPASPPPVARHAIHIPSQPSLTAEECVTTLQDGESGPTSGHSIECPAMPHPRLLPAPCPLLSTSLHPTTYHYPRNCRSITTWKTNLRPRPLLALPHAAVR